LSTGTLGFGTPRGRCQSHALAAPPVPPLVLVLVLVLVDELSPPTPSGRILSSPQADNRAVSDARAIATWRVGEVFIAFTPP
jgi:hypothetical protein